MRPTRLILIVLPFTVLSCVSTGKYKAMQAEANKYDTLYTWSMRTLKTCQDANNNLGKQKVKLQSDANDMKLLLTVTQDNNSQLRKQLQTLSALSSAQAESISKSLDNIGAKDAYIQNLQAAIAHRDSVNLVLVLHLKATIGGFGEDVSIKTEKGFVYVDLSDRILFNSDSNSSGYILTDKAKTVLGRLARVLNDQPDLEFTVEGHTEGISSHTDKGPSITDNAVAHTDSAVAHTDSAAAHTDSAVAHTDSAVTLADSAVAHIDSAVSHTDSAVSHRDSSVTLTNSAVSHTDTAVSSPDSLRLTLSDSLKVVLPESLKAALSDSKASMPDSLKAKLPDNWEISVQRATAIVHLLQNEYHVSPQRMTAAGRGEYIPVASNDTPEGRAANRRTRIVILPQMDQLLKVLQVGQRRDQGQVQQQVQTQPQVQPAAVTAGN
jgi:flagellar motor protein MotB